MTILEVADYMKATLGTTVNAKKGIGFDTFLPELAEFKRYSELINLIDNYRVLSES